MPLTPQERREAMMRHIDALIELAGLDRSESATEIFASLLHEAAMNAREKIDREHKKGLSLDCRWIIAETLTKNKWIRVTEGKTSTWVWPKTRTQ